MFAAYLRPGLRLCELTRPFGVFAEWAKVTLPIRQWLCEIACLAARSRLPVTFGTEHTGLAIAKLRETLGAGL